MKIYLFDIDGTLTPARKVMENNFHNFFSTWIKTHRTFLVGGSDYEKIKEQVPSDIINECSGVFSCMGNMFHIMDELIYKKENQLPNECLEFLQKKLNETKYNDLGKLHFEFRTGTVNFSVVGRDVSYDNRLKYYQWDKIHNERKSIADEFNKTFSSIGYEAKIGGQISLDIQKIGHDKSQVIDYLKSKFTNVEFEFYGDKTFEGGNDYDLAQKIIKDKVGKYYQVSDPNECMSLLNAVVAQLD